MNATAVDNSLGTIERIRVYAKPTFRAPAGQTVVYCGRTWGGWDASPLGNPFHIPYGKDTPEERARILASYKRWLKAACKDEQGRLRSTQQRALLLKLADLVDAGEHVRVGCWCPGGKACHYDVIIEAVNAHVAARRAQRAAAPEPQSEPVALPTAVKAAKPRSATVRRRVALPGRSTPEAQLTMSL